MRIYELMEDCNYLSEEEFDNLTEAQINMLLEKGWLGRGLKGAAMAGALAAGSMGGQAHAQAPDFDGGPLLGKGPGTELSQDGGVKAELTKIYKSGKWMQKGNSAGIKTVRGKIVVIEFKPGMNDGPGECGYGGNFMVAGQDDGTYILSVDKKLASKGKFEVGGHNERSYASIDEKGMRALKRGSAASLMTHKNTYTFSLQGSTAAFKKAMQACKNL